MNWCPRMAPLTKAFDADPAGADDVETPETQVLNNPPPHLLPANAASRMHPRVEPGNVTR